MAVTSDLPYLINDADNHFNEPLDCFERYIDPSKLDLAIRMVRDPNTGKRMQLFAGKPSKYGSSEADQVTFSEAELKKMLGDTSNVGVGKAPVPQQEGEKELRVIPGMLLNRLNPLRGLSEDERKAFVAEFRNQSEAFGNRELRLALMDDQGIDKGVMYPAAAHDIEYEFADNVDA